MEKYNRDTSQKLKEFLKMCAEVRAASVSLPDKIQSCNKATNDFLHEIEFIPLKHHEIAKLAKKKRAELQERRDYKNELEIITPLAKFLETPEGKQFIRKLETVQGDTARAEERINSRSYKYRSQESVIDHIPEPPAKKEKSLKESILNAKVKKWRKEVNG